MKTVLGRAEDRDLRLHIAGCRSCQKAIEQMEDGLRSEAGGLERYPFELQPQAAGPGPASTRKKPVETHGRGPHKPAKAAVRRKTK